MGEPDDRGLRGHGGGAGPPESSPAPPPPCHLQERRAPTAMARVFRMVKLRDYFDGRGPRRSDSHRSRNSAPEPVLLALERLGAAPDRAVYVGDAPADIAAGVAWPPIAVTWGCLFGYRAGRRGARLHGRHAGRARRPLPRGHAGSRAHGCPPGARRVELRRRPTTCAAAPRRCAARSSTTPISTTCSTAPSDAEYDALLHELQDIEADYPELRTPDSPGALGRWAAAQEKFTLGGRLQAMLSLANAPPSPTSCSPGHHDSPSACVARPWRSADSSYVTRAQDRRPRHLARLSAKHGSCASAARRAGQRRDRRRRDEMPNLRTIHAVPLRLGCGFDRGEAVPG